MTEAPKPMVPPLRVPISVRAYAEEETDPVRAKPGRFRSAKRPEPKAKPTGLRRMRERAGPTDWALVFDTETTTDAAQRFRIGFYRLYQGDRLDEERVFYDPGALTEPEIATVRAYAEQHSLGEPLTLDAFRAEVLIERGVRLGGTIVTFNGPFDFARVALGWSPARASPWRRKMQGGFSLRISENDNDARLQLKNLNARATLVELTAPRRQPTSRSRRKQGERTPANRGFHVDVKTLAAALTSRVHSLESLTRALETPTQKRASDDHGGPITEEYLDYARDDVQATWECYAALLVKYGAYGLNAAPHTITSEASIGKAALATMGIKPWLEAQPAGPNKQLAALVMSTYYGGRTEVRIRRALTQVMLTDFTSMYPTVCTLQGLWRFVTGQGFSQREATEETRALVDAATPEQFQDPLAWPKLTALVRIRPDDDLVPIRAAYTDGAAVLVNSKANKPPNSTIGLNYLSCEEPLWFTLADVLVAKFLSGKSPVIEEAIIFEPGPPQSGLQPIKLMGRHDLHPYKLDFYRELIRARQADEAAKVGKDEEEAAQIEDGRGLLKLVANAASYGIFVQINVNGEPKGAYVRVHQPEGGGYLRRMTKIETAGPWFNPLVATLITGAARLMLALAEHRAESVGLEWAFCDTDSLAIAKPADMERAEFERLAKGVVDWFRPLNPYGFDESILKIEKQNYAADGSGDLTPLFCWAISSKRYALFNVSPDGHAIIRKASAHGLGHLIAPYGVNDAPTCFPAPLPEVLSGREKLQRWHYDVWSAILRAVLAGRPNEVHFDYHPALMGPTASRFTASTPEHVNWFKAWNEGKDYCDQVKPFGFLYLLHLSRYARHPDAANDPLEDGEAEDGDIHPVAPFDKDLKVAIAQAFDRANPSGGLINIDRLETYAEMLASYPFRPEAKFFNGRAFDTGRTERRHIQAIAVNMIGKEADRMDEEYLLGVRGESAIDYGGDPIIATRAAFRLRDAIAAFGKASVAKATGVSRNTLAKIVRGERAATNVDPARINEALRRLTKYRSSAQKAKDAELGRLKLIVANEGGIRPAARRLGIDPSNLAKCLKRKTL